MMNIFKKIGIFSLIYALITACIPSTTFAAYRRKKVVTKRMAASVAKKSRLSPKKPARAPQRPAAKPARNVPSRPRTAPKKAPARTARRVVVHKAAAHKAVARRKPTARPASRITRRPAAAYKPAKKTAPTPRRRSPAASTASSAHKATLARAKILAAKGGGLPSKPVIPHDPSIIFVPVAKQAGAECGYHALFNAWNRYEQLHGRAAQTFPLKRWKQAVKSARNNGNDQLIDTEEILTLMHQSGINPATLTVIPNITQFKLNAQHIAPCPHLHNVPAVVRKLRTVDGNGNCHAFVIGNMSYYESTKGQTRATTGHWIAVVVQRKNNQLLYYVMDSIGGKPYTSVMALKKLIEGATGLAIIESDVRKKTNDDTLSDVRIDDVDDADADTNPPVNLEPQEPGMLAKAAGFVGSAVKNAAGFALGLWGKLIR
jgi:hypothetical protein